MQSTYNRQITSFADSASVRAEGDYLVSKLASPISVEELLDDTRLLRSAMTAFGLAGEEWKRGFIAKALEEVANPESTFLARLNNPQYTRFAEAFKPVNGVVSLTADQISDIRGNFESEAFEQAVGEQDDSMRLALNFKSEIGLLATNGSSDQAIAYRLLGSVPIRTVLEAATNLPAEIRSLDIDRQADMLTDRLKSAFGIRSLSQLAEPETLERVVQRFHAMESLKGTASGYSSASVALTLLSNIGSQGRQNLFQSQF